MKAPAHLTAITLLAFFCEYPNGFAALSVRLSAPAICVAVAAHRDERIPVGGVSAANAAARDHHHNRSFPTPNPGAPPASGPGGFGRGGLGPSQPRRKLVEQFDKDRSGRLDQAERQAAQEFLRQERAAGRGSRGFSPRGFSGRGSQGPPQPGPHLSPADVPPIPHAPLYDPTALRTFFLEFENPDWEQELADFYHTDVEVPATLSVDGKVYPNVGVHFRGASSFFTVGEGRKRSLGLSLDFADPGQRLHGCKSLDLLNSHDDATFLRTVLYSEIARRYLPAPKANYVKVAINGECWGVYVNAQPFNRNFLKEWFPNSSGTRWKVPGNPRGGGGLAYLGDDVEEYKRRYQLKAGEEAGAWNDLIRLCRTLSETPLDSLEDALAPMLNIDRTLWFLALENALINNDGYWIRASDYTLFRDRHGRFHLVPHDANETFLRPGGPGFGRGPQISGVELDPFFGSDDPNKPLLSRLLAVPSLKARYTAHVRTIAEEWLDWKKIGPLAEQFQALIADDVKADTRKLNTFEGFQKGLAEDFEEEGFRGPRRILSLKSFVEQRRRYLLNHAEIKKPAATITSAKLAILRDGALAEGHPTARDSMLVTVETSGEVIPDRVLLYYASARETPFKRVEMKNNEPGRYTALIPPMGAGAEVHYYVEAASSAAGSASFFPAAAEFGALKY